MPAAGGRLWRLIAATGPTSTYVGVNTILDLLEFSFGRHILEISTVKVSYHLHAIAISVMVNKPTRIDQVRSFR